MKHQSKPAPVALASSHVVSVLSAPLNKMSGSVRLSTEPFAVLYALRIAEAFASLMLLNCKLSVARLGRLPHNLRVITPDCDACVLVGHVGETKLRLVGSTVGNVVAMIR